MRFKGLTVIAACAALIGSASSLAAHRYKFPVTNADDAIAVAKDICLKHGGPLYDEDMNKTSIRKAMPTLQWKAEKQNDTWYVDTEPSVFAGTNVHLLTVDLPIDGPAPDICSESMYDFVGTNPPPKKPRGPCDPSDISARDAQDLALEVIAPDGGVSLEALKPETRKTYWRVTVRQRGHEDWHFKVFKRSANVLDEKTGEFFTSLRSKAQYVEHHCLDKRWWR